MKSIQFELEPNDNHRLSALCGDTNNNLHLIEHYLAVEIIQRGNTFKIVGPKTAIHDAKNFIHQLFDETKTTDHFENHDLQVALQGFASAIQDTKASPTNFEQQYIVQCKNHSVKPRTINQERYIKRIQENDINFGVGPAGTGKTYLAIACAVAALEVNAVKRIILVRPAVEAGENLGFLPGDLAQKVDPYMRPMYDALYDLIGVEQVGHMIEKQIIEIAPLAYMRGRTLNDAFIVLDEAQNTTKEQMKMFLTRIGFNSTAIITGDITQVDLPKHVVPGLRDAIEVLAGVEGISMTFFETVDVVRHPLVQKVVAAYDKHEGK
ncbi:PhoH family protein [Francisellaceae bacterium]|nr:PhoH family protein [Francisellaceae bacterium]